MVEGSHIWIIAGFVLCVVEILASSFVVAVSGAACSIVALFAGTGMPAKMQLLVFGIAPEVMPLTKRPLLHRHFCGRKAKIKTNVDVLVASQAW